MKQFHDIQKVTLTSRLRGIFTPGIRKKIIVGTRVEVSKNGGWARDSTGVVTDGPESVNTRQGEDYFYFVKFDEPQHDLSEDGPYEKAQILSRYLNAL